jgi:hypothetical protein
MYELHIFVLAVQKCLAWLPTVFLVSVVSAFAVYAFTQTNQQLADSSGQTASGGDTLRHHSHRVRDFMIGLTGMCVLAAAAQ